MNDMPAFQPTPMFEDQPAPKAERVKRKRRTRKARAQPEAEPKGPKKPKPKPARKKRVVRKTPMLTAPYGKAVKRKQPKIGAAHIINAVAGLNDDQVTVLTEVLATFEHLNATGKTKVSAALAKLYP